LGKMLISCTDLFESCRANDAASAKAYFI